MDKEDPLSRYGLYNETLSKNIHISLELETWGTRLGSDIRSIGACVFDPLTGAVDMEGKGTFHVACDNPLLDNIHNRAFAGNPDLLDGVHRKYNLRRDSSTIQWWEDQGEEAKAAFASPVELGAAIDLFTNWMMSVTPFQRIPIRTVCLWSHDAAFDPPRLEIVANAVGREAIWHYRSPRNTRTVFDLAGIVDHSAFMKEHRVGVFHNALDDAISQARAICAAVHLIYR